MQQRGFTLIELVIVIVILGILAVTAAPRFIDLQGDARASTLQGAKAAMTSGMQLVYAKSAIAGEQANAHNTTDTSRVTINDNAVETDFGYPDAESMTTIGILNHWIEMNAADWTLTTDSPLAGSFAITPNGVAYSSDTDTQCQLIYAESTGANVVPVLTLQTGGC